MTVHDARRTCATLLVDLEVHPQVIMRIRHHADVSMTLKIYASSCADGDPRSAAQAGAAPCDAQVNSRIRCCTYRTLLLYWQPETPSPVLVRSLTCTNVVGVTGFEPAASSSRTTSAVVEHGR
jgi:hypothetical protein